MTNPADEALPSFLVVDQRVRDPQEWAARFRAANAARANAGGRAALLRPRRDDRAETDIFGDPTPRTSPSS